MRTRRNILLVVPDRCEAMNIQRYLVQLTEWNVTIAGTLADGGRELAGLAQDVVLLALNLPDSHGIETIRRMRAMAGLIPIIVLVEANDHGRSIKSLKAGAHDYLRKDELSAAAIQYVIEHACDRFAMETAWRDAFRFTKSALDALTQQIGILDDSGKILVTNRAWRGARTSSRPTPPQPTEGCNYLEILDQQAGEGWESSGTLAEGIRSIIRCERTDYIQERCDSVGGVHRWSSVRVSKFGDPGPTRLVVTCEDLTS